MKPIVLKKVVLGYILTSCMTLCFSSNLDGLPFQERFTTVPMSYQSVDNCSYSGSLLSRRLKMAKTFQISITLKAICSLISSVGACRIGFLNFLASLCQTDCIRVNLGRTDLALV